MKHPNKLQQQSSQKIETTKVAAIMEQLDELNGNRHVRKTNIIHFTPLFEFDDEEGTNHMKIPNNPTIVLSENEEGRENKGYQNKGNDNGEYHWEEKITEKTYDPDIDNELNGEFKMEEYNYNRDHENEDQNPDQKDKELQKPRITNHTP